MRIIFYLLMMLPFIAKAQINRSASQLAHENIREYINTKIFKGYSYKPVSYGELKPNQTPNSDIVWYIDHKFEIEEPQKNPDKRFVLSQQPYRFIFYLDKKMRIVSAEAIKF